MGEAVSRAQLSGAQMLQKGRTEKEAGIDKEERELGDREEPATTTSLFQSASIPPCACVCVYTPDPT